jgi:putative membrane protein
MLRPIGLVGCAILAASALVAAPAAAQKFDTKDANFVKDAAQCSMLEFELAKLATTNASSEDVKQFSKRIIDDHAKVDQELVKLAGNKGVTLPKTLEDKKCKELCDKMSKLKGKDFDREYMRHVVDDHEKALAEFQTAAKSLTDPDLKAWVTKTLPTLTDHLRQAKEVQAKIAK